MSIKDNYYIKEIDHKTAMNIVIKCHYAHRSAPYTRAFGLFSKSPHRIVGVVIYGSPVSNGLCEQICGVEEKYNVYELTRLYVDDGLEKNLESFLVGNTLKMLDKEIIVSFSDIAYNHVGIIYQATNFYYTGITQGNHTDYVEVEKDGKVLHHKSVSERYGGVEGIRQAMANGANIYAKERSHKHRYIYFNCDKKRKKELLAKLKYEILPYPKQEGACPRTSTENIFDNVKGGLF